MSELEDRIGAVLSDPEQMGRLTRMAQQLMGGGAPEPSPEGQGPGKEKGPQRRSFKGSGRGKPLLEALGPYLDEERRRRLERALRLASTARIAASVLGKTGGDDGI